jgi:DNA-binding CsgD family transcriptional regulator/DNA-binding XRE family transcriptional regulator
VSVPVQVAPSRTGGATPVANPDVLLEDVAVRIRAEREARGWSRDQLARRAGISRSAVGRLEAGDVWLRSLAKACTALRVPVDYLLSDRWMPPARKPTLTPVQVTVLGEAASGDSLEAVGDRLRMTSQAVSSVLSKIYVRLGVADLPRDQKRAAAVRVASAHGLLDPRNRTS